MKIKYSTRLVIILFDIVIKIPLSRRGYLQGINEKRIWDRYKTIGSLAELKWMCMGIVCQKRYSTIDEIPLCEVYAIKKTIPEFDFDNCDFHNPENWGIDNGQYVLLDYGNNSYVASLY